MGSSGSKRKKPIKDENQKIPSTGQIENTPKIIQNPQNIGRGDGL